MKIESLLNGPEQRARQILAAISKLPQDEVFNSRDLGMTNSNNHRVAELIPENSYLITGVKCGACWYFGSRNAIAKLRRLCKPRNLT